jgi:hypothetical protein
MSYIRDAFSDGKAGRRVLLVAMNAKTAESLADSLAKADGISKVHRRGETVGIFADGGGFVRIITQRQAIFGAARGCNYDRVYVPADSDSRLLEKVYPTLMGRLDAQPVKEYR